MFILLYGGVGFGPDSDSSVTTDCYIADKTLKVVTVEVILCLHTEIGLKPKGSLATIRTVLCKTDGYELVVDENRYLGHADYELEIEYAPDNENNAQVLLKNLHGMLIQKNRFLKSDESISGASGVRSKANRFFERINNGKIPTQSRNGKSSENGTNVFGNLDNNGYMRDYFDSITPEKSICLSCSYFKGWLCDTPDGVCEYECN